MPRDRRSDQGKGLQAASPLQGSFAAEGKILDGAIHELQNHLQSIGMGLDLLQMTQPDALEYRTMVQGIERASRLLREVREYFFPPEWRVSSQSLMAVLEEIIREKQAEWHEQHVRLRVIRRDPSLRLALDWHQVRSALERLLAFVRALLSSEGGKIDVAGRVRESGGRHHVELTISGSSVAPLEIEEADIFRPFLRVHTYQAGLSLVLVQQLVNRQGGQVCFRKTSPHQGQFTLLLKTAAEQ